MNRITTRISIALLLFAVSAASASAKVRKQVITFGQDFIVGGTGVKAGTYIVSFDDEKNELALSDKKSKAVVAKTEARMRARKSDTRGLDVQLVGDGTQSLVGIGFPGEKQLVAISGVAARKN